MRVWLPVHVFRTQLWLARCVAFAEAGPLRARIEMPDTPFYARPILVVLEVLVVGVGMDPFS
eukprot:3933910-Lingulodinium_polyedra.AAC.1